MARDSGIHRILIVSGSTRRSGLTSSVLRLAEDLLQQRGLDTEFICVRDLALPAYGMRDDTVANAAAWRQAVDRASAVIFGSPEYHGSFSGALKNLLDHLDASHIRGRPAAIVAAAGGPRSGIATLNAMRVVLRSLHVPVIVEQVAAWEGDFTPGTRLPTAGLVDYLTAMVDALVRELERRLNQPARRSFTALDSSSTADG
jgi:azobenzene reductase